MSTQEKQVNTQPQVEDDGYDTATDDERPFASKRPREEETVELAVKKFVKEIVDEKAELPVATPVEEPVEEPVVEATVVEEERSEKVKRILATHPMFATPTKKRKICLSDFTMGRKQMRLLVDLLDHHNDVFMSGEDDEETEEDRQKEWQDVLADAVSKVEEFCGSEIDMDEANKVLQHILEV